MRIFVLLVCLNLTVGAALMPGPKADPRPGMPAETGNAVSSPAGAGRARTVLEKPSHVAGVISAVAHTSFEIISGPGAQGRMRVRFDSRTDFVDCEPGDLEPGRGADIIGVRLRNGDFAAARVVVSESGCPVHTPEGAILYHAREGDGNDARPVSPSPCSSGAGSI